jgi:hypothetical protein
VLTASEAAAYSCGACGVVWSEDDRAAALLACEPIHKGQRIEVVSGRASIVGDLPRTDTLGFWWSARENLIRTAGEVASEEWRADRDPDSERSERDILKNEWGVPDSSEEGEEGDAIEITVATVQRRSVNVPEGIVPPGAEIVTLTADLGKRLLHWTAEAWWGASIVHVLGYGAIDVHTDDLGVERAVRAAVHELHELGEEGWAGPSGRFSPTIGIVDARWQRASVLAAIDELGGLDLSGDIPSGWIGSFGHGLGPEYVGKFRQPKRRQATRGERTYRLVRSGYYLSREPESRNRFALHFDADRWKAYLHARIATRPLDADGARAPGSFSIYQAAARDLLGYAKQLTAETLVDEFVEGKGRVRRFRRRGKRANHWLDSTTLGVVGAMLCGIPPISEGDAETPPASSRPKRGDWFSGRRERR